MTNDLDWMSPSRFLDWPIAEVPPAAAGVYTIWEDETLLYVGMSGRSRTASELAQAPESGKRTRLNSHASGRRSGDQFCAYVCDRLVLRTLNPDDIDSISRGQLRLDNLGEERVRSQMSFKFVETANGATASVLEQRLRAGGLGQRPTLNPG